MLTLQRSDAQCYSRKYVSRFAADSRHVLSYVAALSEPPIFAEPIPNVTVALGRDVSLPCVIENLGTYKVRR